MRTRWIRWLAASLMALAFVGCDVPPEVAELRGRTMGTQYTVQVSPPPEPAMRDRLQRLIEQRLRAINAQMSTYLPDSDLERFNRSPATDWQPVPRAVAMLVSRAQAISTLTDGRYDVTIAPLVHLWGFGNEGDRSAPPGEDEIAALLPRIGYHHLAVRLEPPALRKRVPGLSIDLSSIAKGWAVDELSQLLKDQGINGFLVEIGGETRASGRKADGSPWRIAIERPGNAAPEALTVLEAEDLAVATSGDYRNYFEHDGQRYSHTLDPVSGQTVRHRLAAVTVAAKDCTDADAWATALMSLGDRAGPALAEELSLAALFVVRDGEQLRTSTSTAWDARQP